MKPLREKERKIKKMEKYLELNYRSNSSGHGFVGGAVSVRLMKETMSMSDSHI